MGEVEGRSASDAYGGDTGCFCGDVDCWHLAANYPWCRPCEEHHRPPECAVDEQGRALAWCGHPWHETEAGCVSPELHD